MTQNKEKTEDFIQLLRKRNGKIVCNEQYRIEDLLYSFYDEEKSRIYELVLEMYENQPWYKKLYKTKKRFLYVAQGLIDDIDLMMGKLTRHMINYIDLDEDLKKRK